MPWFKHSNLKQMQFQATALCGRWNKIVIKYIKYIPISCPTGVENGFPSKSEKKLVTFEKSMMTQRMYRCRCCYKTKQNKSHTNIQTESKDHCDWWLLYMCTIPPVLYSNWNTSNWNTYLKYINLVYFVFGYLNKSNL